VQANNKVTSDVDSGFYLEYGYVEKIVCLLTWDLGTRISELEDQSATNMKTEDPSMKLHPTNAVCET